MPQYQFPQVSAAHGAPMGRPSSPALSFDVGRSIKLFRVVLDRQGYDNGGAYWGRGAPIYAAIDHDGNMQTVRADSRELAALALEIPPACLLRAGKQYAHWLQRRLALTDDRTSPDMLTRGKTLVDYSMPHTLALMRETPERFAFSLAHRALAESYAPTDLIDLLTHKPAYKTPADAEQAERAF